MDNASTGNRHDSTASDFRIAGHGNGLQRLKSAESHRDQWKGGTHYSSDFLCVSDSGMQLDCTYYFVYASAANMYSKFVQTMSSVKLPGNHSQEKNGGGQRFANYEQLTTHTSNLKRACTKLNATQIIISSRSEKPTPKLIHRSQAPS